MRDCDRCNIRRAKKTETSMSDLSLSRASAHKKPFADCGIDYFGPLTFKERRSLKKDRVCCLRVWRAVPFM